MTSAEISELLADAISSVTAGVGDRRFSAVVVKDDAPARVLLQRSRRDMIRPRQSQFRRRSGTARR
jgi:hypothetical protein